MTPFFLSFFLKNKMKIKKNFIVHWALNSESPTTSAKALNTEHSEETKSTVSKEKVFIV